jgi:hypothetical protein
MLRLLLWAPTVNQCDAPLGAVIGIICLYVVCSVAVLLLRNPWELVHPRRWLFCVFSFVLLGW